MDVKKSKAEIMEHARKIYAPENRERDYAHYWNNKMVNERERSMCIAIAVTSMSD